MRIQKITESIRSTLLLARSMKRIADALERQNQIRATELLELHGIVIPDLDRKWSKKDREVEVSYGEQAVPTEDQEADDFTDVFRSNR